MLHDSRLHESRMDLVERKKLQMSFVASVVSAALAVLPLSLLAHCCLPCLCPWLQVSPVQRC